MLDRINPRIKSIQISGIRQFFNKVQSYEDVISLTIGQPDFPTPSLIKKKGIEAIQSDRTVYTGNAGMLELREAISSYVMDRYDLRYHPENEIIVTTGASQAIDATLRTILEAGDEVILPGPVYPGYEPLITLAGAKPVYADTRAHEFKLTADLIEKNITSETKAVIIPYPSNPTGVSLTEKELNDIAKVIKKHKIFFLADEIYSELVYDRKHISIASFQEVRDQVIVINGLSKSHSMTGWRIGYLLAPEWLASHILKVHQYNVSCASSISQCAALEALTNGQSQVNTMNEEYKKRRDYVCKRLSKMGLEYQAPDGAFYIFLKVPLTGSSSGEWAQELVEKGGLALVPGSAFSESGEGYVRLSYAYSLQTLKKGLDRLEKFI